MQNTPSHVTLIQAFKFQTNQISIRTSLLVRIDEEPRKLLCLVLLSRSLSCSLAVHDYNPTYIENNFVYLN